MVASTVSYGLFAMFASELFIFFQAKNLLFFLLESVIGTTSPRRRKGIFDPFFLISFP